MERKQASSVCTTISWAGEHVSTFTTRANEKQIYLDAYGTYLGAGLTLNPRMNLDDAATIDTNPYIVEDVEVSGEITPERFDRPFGGGSYTDRGTRAGLTCSLTIRSFNTLDTQILAQHLMQLAYAEYTGTMLDATTGPFLQFGYSASEDACKMLAIRLVADPQIKQEGNTYLTQVVIGSDFPFLVDNQMPLGTSAALTAGGSGFSIPLTIPFQLVQSSGGDVSPTDYSTMPETFSILRAYGPITNPRVTMYDGLGSSKQLAFNGSIANGDYWTIDLWSKRVFANDNEAATITTLDVANSEWFGIPTLVGTPTIALSGSGYSATTKLTIKNIGAIV